MRQSWLTVRQKRAAGRVRGKRGSSHRNEWQRGDAEAGRLSMSAWLGYTIVGISTAAIFAVIASGLVLTYTTTGVFNFAHGAVGMLAAFCYWQLHVDWGLNTLLSVFLVVFILAPLLGLLIELIMRLLRDVSEATTLVGTVVLLFGMIAIAQLVWNQNVARSVDQFFSGRTIDLGPTRITYHQLITLVVALLVAAGLRFLLYRTKVGVSMKAVVDNADLSRLNGVRTITVQQLSWVISIMLAAIGGVLVASTAGLNAVVLSVLIVNAYAAAIFGRLRSLPLTFAGALVIGLADAYLKGYLPSGNQYVPGLQLASPVIILFIVLLLIPQQRLRGLVRTREYFPAPSVNGAIGFCVAVLIGGAMLATTLSPSDLLKYQDIFPIAIIALSLVPLLGFANQASLCQFSFAAIGGATMAHLGVGGNPLGLLGAILIPAAIGGLITLPAMRLSGIYLALATAAFAVFLDRWIFNLPPFNLPSGHTLFFWHVSPEVTWIVLAVVSAAIVAGLVYRQWKRSAVPSGRSLWYGGAVIVVGVFLERWIFGLSPWGRGSGRIALFEGGTATVDPLRVFGWHFDPGRSTMLLSVVALAICSALVAWMRRSRLGRQLVAARDSEPACATFGMSLIGTRLAVFMIAAGMAGLGGALLAIPQGSVQATSFEFTTGLPIFMLVAAGGAGFISAGLFTGVTYGALFTIVPAVAPGFTQWAPLLTLFTIVGLGLEPSGAAPQFAKGFRNFTGRPAIKWTTLTVLVLVWIGRLSGLYGNALFLVLLVVAFIVGVAVSEVAATLAGESRGWEEPGARAERVTEPPLELVGPVYPWTPQRLASTDANLALDEFGMFRRHRDGVLFADGEQREPAPSSAATGAPR